jgi:ribosomal protein L40E
MKCPRCQHENPPHAKFCLECGARVAPTCTKCRRGDLLRGLMNQLNNGLCSEVDMRHIAELLNEVYEE